MKKLTITQNLRLAACATPHLSELLLRAAAVIEKQDQVIKSAGIQIAALQKEEGKDLEYDTK